MNPAPPVENAGNGGSDAVCFTAGYNGASFGAGVIHAWLAADRKPPEVAAGISMGALSAAAMQRSYQELEGASEPAEREVRRWRWFRSYLSDLSDRPLSVIWDSVPDPIDFFADKPPVVDRSCPPPLQAAEAESRRNYYRLVKLGRWLAGLPVSVSSVARAVVSYVRYKEKYGAWGPLRGLLYRVRAGRVVFSVFRHFCLSPQWTLEAAAGAPPDRAAGRGWRVRPLFGWPAWTAAVLAGGSLVYWVLRLGAPLLPRLPPVPPWLPWVQPWMGPALSWARGLDLRWLASPWLSWPAMVVAGLVGFLLAASLHGQLRSNLLGALVPYLLQQLQISRGLVHEYRFRRRLFELFREEPSATKDPAIKKSPMRVVIVAAPLQELGLPTWRGFFWKEKRLPRLMTPLSGQQVWASPDTSLITALRAALAIPGVFPPVRLTDPASIKQWLSESQINQMPSQLDLVDGAVIRENPIPALFAWLKGRQGQVVAQNLERGGPEDPRVHVVYNVPIEPAVPPPGAELPERINIVRSAFASIELDKHRDTQVEVRQTNFISALQSELQQVGPQSVPLALRIFADEIAPDKEIQFDNNLDPTRKEFLTIAAEGCRKTLEKLYRQPLLALPAAQEGIPCHSLLASITAGRQSFVSAEAPGLREVCHHCTRHLRRPPPAVAPTPPVNPPYGLRAGTELADAFPHLRGDRPRIVFVASGGVFRGAFHIGVLAALRGAGIRPDLVVGASVGALMGGALGAISVLGDRQASQLLAKLTSVFLHVDQRVALTSKIKNAAKQLGIRARNIDLSPAELRRQIRKGTRSDPGYAALGAPPVLLDAISELFFLPHGKTRGIAAEFVAGHVTGALKQFWEAVQEETLRHLDIEYALIGTSLLEPVARTLLGESFGMALDTTQPYHRDPYKVSFFSTTSNLNDRRALLLGRDFLRAGHSYAFVKAALSSSAFPAVFSPRQEAEVIPGTGRTDVLFSDGGMFDNLPFFPAMEVLSAVQANWRQRSQTAMSQYDFLRLRSQQPDLFIAGALDASVRPQDGEKFEDLRSIRSRASILKNNVKLDTFEAAAELVGRQIQHLVQNGDSQTRFQDPSLLDDIVSAAVLKIVPTDAEHVNPTFAFCASTGLEIRRVQLSIADGCYQTLRTIAHAQDATDQTLAGRSVKVLSSENQGKIRKIDRIPRPTSVPSGQCPFFKVAGDFLPCPFVKAAQENPDSGEARAIYDTCRKDQKHAE